jgi:hypothetical protein
VVAEAVKWVSSAFEQQLPLDLNFRDERPDGQAGSVLWRRPVVLSLVYYNCPMLCADSERHDYCIPGNEVPQALSSTW